jgi:hypothetical protein
LQDAKNPYGQKQQPPIASGDPLSRNPITGIAGCCARAASGHAAAALPSAR